VRLPPGPSALRRRRGPPHERDDGDGGHAEPRGGDRTSTTSWCEAGCGYDQLEEWVLVILSAALFPDT
jgi:hypothetical protein